MVNNAKDDCQLSPSELAAHYADMQAGIRSMNGNQLDQYFKLVPRPEFLIDDLLPARWVGLSGKSTHGKGMLSAHLTCALASGDACLWGALKIRNTGLNVFYVYTDDKSHDEFLKRTKAMDPRPATHNRVHYIHAPQSFEDNDAWDNLSSLANESDLIIFDNLIGANGQGLDLDKGPGAGRAHGRFRQIATDKPLLLVMHTSDSKTSKDIAHSYGLTAMVRDYLHVTKNETTGRTEVKVSGHSVKKRYLLLDRSDTNGHLIPTGGTPRFRKSSTLGRSSDRKATDASATTKTANDIVKKTEMYQRLVKQPASVRKNVNAAGLWIKSGRLGSGRYQVSKGLADGWLDWNNGLLVAGHKLKM